MPSPQVDRPTFDDVLEARQRQMARVRRTPVLDDPRLDRALGRSVAVKAEFIQRSGSFKFRGIDNSIDALSADAAARGVIIVSSGNAGQAAALSSALRGVPCTVVMADGAVPTKIKAIQALGATVVLAGHTAESVFGKYDELASEQRLTKLHPFDHREVIAGHGSMTLEILEDCPDVGTIVVPAGGGGLLASVALVTKSVAPHVRVIGVQPAVSDALHQSFVTGSRVELTSSYSVADGLAMEQCGELTFDIVREMVDEIVVVTEDEICSAMALVWETLRVGIEPSAAASIAALARHEWSSGREIAVATGGNFEPALLAHVVAGGTPADWTLTA